MADAAAAAAKRKKIIEDAKQRAKTMRRNTIFNFGLPSSKSNGPLPQSGLKKTTGLSSFADALSKKRTLTQRLTNRLFGRPAAPAPAPVAAPVVADAPTPVAAPIAAPAPVSADAPVAVPAPDALSLINAKTRRKASEQIPNVNAARKFIKEYNSIPNEQKKDLDAINHAKYHIAKERVYPSDIPHIIRLKLNDDSPIENKEGIKTLTDLIKEYQEVSLFKGPNDRIQGLYTDLKKFIREIIPERKKLDQLKKDSKTSLQSTTQSNSEKVETIRKYNELKRSLFNKHNSIKTLIDEINFHIKTCESKKKFINSIQGKDIFIDYNVFTVKEPIYLERIRKYIEFLEEPLEDLGMYKRSTLLYSIINGISEEDSTKILNEIATKSTDNDFYDNSDSIHQEMKEAIALFTTNFPLIKELKKIKDTRNKMHNMDTTLYSNKLHYSYRKSRNPGSETRVEDHKNKIIEVLRSTMEKNNNDIDIRRHTDEDIQFFLERRGQYNDVEEMAYIENTPNNIDRFKDLLKMANYINKYEIKKYINDIDLDKLLTDDSYYSKKSNEAFDTVVKMYHDEKNSPENEMYIQLSFNNKWYELLSHKKNRNNIRNEDYKEVIKSIIKENTILTTPYRLTKFLLTIPKIQKERIQENFIQRIYNSIEQEDMDEAIKEKKVKNEIDTNEKAIAFLKEYLLNPKENINEGNTYRFGKSLELLHKNKLWPYTLDEAKTFIEQYKDIANTDPKYFILEKAKGMIQNAEAKRIREAMNAQSRQNNAGKAKWLKEIKNVLDNEGEDAKCLLASDKRPELRDESFDEAYKRLLVFLYHKMKQIPIDPPDKYQLNPDEEKELINSILQFGHEHDYEKMAQDLFHTDIGTLSTEIQFFEYNDPTRPPSTDPNKNKRILDKGKLSQRCSLSTAKYFPRAITLIRSHGRKLNYKAAYSTHLCEVLSKDCVTIVNDKEFYDNELPDDGKTKSYIVVDPKYFPESSTIPINIIYSRLPLVTFVIDAFLNNAVIEIEPVLEAKMKEDFPELFGLKVTTEKAETMLNNAIVKKIKTKKNLNATWLTNRNKSIRQKAYENASREVDVAAARIEVAQAAAQMKANLAIKERNLGSRAAARASIEKNIRNMNQEKTRKALLNGRKKVEFPGPAPPAPKLGAPFVAGPEAPPAVAPVAAANIFGNDDFPLQMNRNLANSGAQAAAIPPRPKGPRPVAASSPGLPGGPPRAPKPNNLKKAAVASTRKLKELTIPAPAVRKLPALAGIRLPPKPQWVLNARSRVPGASTPGGPAAGSEAPGLAPPAPGLAPPAPGLAPPAPGLAPPAPEAPAPVLHPVPAPKPATAASRNKSYQNIKTRIGTIRQKFTEAKATINAYKARPKGKAQAKGGRRTRKLKSRR